MQITTRFRQCGINKMCHCAFHIKYDSSNYAYLDFCEDATVYPNKLVLKYLNTQSLQHSSVNCQAQIDEETLDNDANSWDAIPFSFDTFKCARVNDSKCETFAIRAGNVIVKYDIDCGEEPLSTIRIKQSELPASTTILGGLCGTIRQCANYLDNANSCVDDANALYSYWKLALVY